MQNSQYLIITEGFDIVYFIAVVDELEEAERLAVKALNEMSYVHGERIPCIRKSKLKSNIRHYHLKDAVWLNHDGLFYSYVIKINDEANSLENYMQERIYMNTVFSETEIGEYKWYENVSLHYFLSN